MTKILVAEDQLDLRELITLSLHLSGYQVISAEDGQQAYQRARSTQPDLIILDLEMPYLTGSQVCERLKSLDAFAHTPVVIISARDGFAHVQDSLDAGATEFIRKPFEINHLLDRVETILAGAS